MNIAALSATCCQFESYNQESNSVCWYSEVLRVAFTDIISVIYV